MSLTEPTLEEAAFEWFGDLGYSCLGPTTLTPALSRGERERRWQIVRPIDLLPRASERLADFDHVHRDRALTPLSLWERGRG
jgi:hypothetical protein